MSRYLVVIDYPVTGRHPPIAGVYVEAATRQEAINEVKAMLAEAKYSAIRKDKQKGQNAFLQDRGA